MQRHLLTAIVMIATSNLVCAQSKINYPPTRKVEVVDNYHGTQVADPYRWLEDVESDETARWVAAQNKLTFEFINAIPERTAIHKRLTELWNYERFGHPIERKGKYYFTHNDGLQNQSPIYVADGLMGAKQVVLDPNTLSKDGTVALGEWKLSDDGRYLAYSIADGGSDWRRWRVRDVQTGNDLTDEIRWVKFSDFGWTSDSQGFFYSRYDEPKADKELTGTNYFQKVFYHRLGTSQAEDRVVVRRDDQKEWGFRGTVTDDGQYLIVEVWRGTENKNQIFFVDIKSGQWDVKELVTGFDAEYVFLGNDGPLFYMMTDNAADRRRIIAVDSTDPNRDRWRQIVAESTETISAVAMYKNQFLVTYLKDACHEVRLFDTSGQGRGAINLPGLGTVTGFEGKRTATETFYSFTNYITPPTVYRYDLQSGQSTVWQAPKLAFKPEEYVTERVFFLSKDGTRIPMILSAKRASNSPSLARPESARVPRTESAKGVGANQPTNPTNAEFSSNRPTLLYGYGGFDISVTPTYSPANLGWMDLGGVLAVPNLRGGGEYGKPWHEAGMLDKKQNVFDDFIAAAEYLIDRQVTSSDRLAISGRSNGGLLVGATMAQRPELFAAALPAVGVMDMLRYHKFTIGWAWVNEYGSSDDAQQFKNIYAYSPLHNLRPDKPYPATLITTADRDDRVVPGHSFKFAARLQEVVSASSQITSNPRPALIRIETRAGHGAGTPVSKLIDTAADTLSFLKKSFSSPK